MHPLWLVGIAPVLNEVTTQGILLFTAGGVKYFKHNFGIEYSVIPSLCWAAI